MKEKMKKIPTETTGEKQEDAFEKFLDSLMILLKHHGKSIGALFIIQTVLCALFTLHLFISH